MQKMQHGILLFLFSCRPNKGSIEGAGLFLLLCEARAEQKGHGGVFLSFQAMTNDGQICSIVGLRLTQPGSAQAMPSEARQAFGIMGNQTRAGGVDTLERAKLKQAHQTSQLAAVIGQG